MEEGKGESQDPDLDDVEVASSPSAAVLPLAVINNSRKGKRNVTFDDKQRMVAVHAYFKRIKVAGPRLRTSKALGIGMRTLETVLAQYNRDCVVLPKLRVPKARRFAIDALNLEGFIRSTI